jgi:transcription elongation GreA/GreB family factor
MAERQRPSVRIVLRPTLSQCIETTAKREYWKSVDEYLKEKTGDKELEERIELLKSFLETADFATLRSQSERAMAKGNKVTFTVFLKDGKPGHLMRID